MNKLRYLGLVLVAFAFSPLHAKVENTPANQTAQKLAVGYVDFQKCVEKSKEGQHERNAFDSLRKQMQENLEKTNKELEEIVTHLQDQEFMDGLSPSAEEELKQKFQALNQQFNRYQNQYYQLINEAKMAMIQDLRSYVKQASEIVRQRQNLMMILSEDSTFAVADMLNLTDEVVKEMDSRFEKENADLQLSSRG